MLPDGRVVSGGGGGMVLVWNPSQPDGDPVELGRHDGPVMALAVLADGRVVSGGQDQRVLVWSMTQGQIAQLGCSVSRLAAAQAMRGEAFLIVVHGDEGFSLWSTDNGPF